MEHNDGSDEDLAFESILFPESPRSPCGFSFARDRDVHSSSEEFHLNESDDYCHSKSQIEDKDILSSSYENVVINRDKDGNFSVSLKAPQLLSSLTHAKVSLDDFEILRLVGKGAYGKVHQVRKKSDGKIYAMKVMRKEDLIQTNNVSYTITERNILRNIRHPYIASLHYAFQTHGKVYLVMEFLNGGQLLFHMRKKAMFSEEYVRVYAAQMTLALEYLHSLDIVHRDLKPENVLLSSDGHLCLADFGLAKVNVSQNSSGAKTFCGTIEYMAPEIIKGSGHGKAVDWWSLGILIYDMLIGSPPFKSRQRNVLQQQILKGKFKMPNYLSSAAHSIIKGLLRQNPENRLGANGASEIKSHPFFKNINWAVVARKEIDPPFTPEVENGLEDTSYFDKKYLRINPGDSPLEESPLLAAHNDHFQGFSYVRDGHEFFPDLIHKENDSSASENQSKTTGTELDH